MEMSDKIEKYLNKKKEYKPVDTIDNVFKQVMDKSKKDQDKYSKKVAKMLIRDAEGNIYEFNDLKLVESEDGVMAYLTAHPHGGRGRQGYNKGITCPRCGANIDLRR